MCENHCSNCFWPNNFYYQYIQQHAAMTQWIQNLHSNIDVPSAHDANHSCQNTTCYPKAVHYAPESTVYNSSYESGTSSSQNYNSLGAENYSEEKEDEYFEEDESDCEYEFNVDAILAMRKAKEEMKKDESSDSSSIAMIDHVNEEFEIVELGSLQEREAKQSIMVGNSHDKSAKLQCEKEYKEHLYGEKFNTISGLETAMSLTYERLCDIYQPPVWPVYPLRLKSCV